MSQRGLEALPLFAAFPASAQQPAPQPPATQAPAGPQADAGRPRVQMSPADRAAFLDARIAAVHAGLKLNADQEKLWPALETAVRDGLTKLGDMRAKARAAGRPTDPLEGMSRMAEAALTRGEALKKITDAAKPLFASLTDEQKHRLPLLMHGGRREGRGMGDMMRSMMADRGPAGPDGPGMRQRGDGPGPRMGMGTGPGDDRRGPPGGRRRGAEQDAPPPRGDR
jgi:hypothetical protein